MTTPLRNVYAPGFFEQLCPTLEACLTAFDSRHFIFRVFNTTWADMGFRERVQHLARVLHDFLPPDFPSAAERIITIARTMKQRGYDPALANIFLAAYINMYGDQFPDASRQALEEVDGVAGARLASPASPRKNGESVLR